MGNYNSQYESYYSNMLRQKSNQAYRGSNNRNVKLGKDIFVRRIMQELIGVLCLLSIVIGCKFIKTSQSEEFYSYSKKTVNYNYDYTNLYKKVQNITVSDIERKMQEVINKVKASVNSDKAFGETKDV